MLPCRGSLEPEVEVGGLVDVLKGGQLLWGGGRGEGQLEDATQPMEVYRLRATVGHCKLRGRQ